MVFIIVVVLSVAVLFFAFRNDFSPSKGKVPEEKSSYPCISEKKTFQEANKKTKSAKPPSVGDWFWGIGIALFVIFRLLYDGIDTDGIVYIIVAVAIIGWIMMLVDCLIHEKEQQVSWILVLIFVPVLGALLYAFLRFRRNRF